MSLAPSPLCLPVRDQAPADRGEELDRALNCRRAEVTTSEAGRLCDEETLARSATHWCIQKPSWAGKLKIQAQAHAAGSHP